MVFAVPHSCSDVPSASDIEPSLADLVIAFVEQRYREPISLRDVARALGYSPCHLTYAFRRATGMPVTAWIIRRRIHAAMDLLRDTDADVATACASVGFNDVYYFKRQFVRHAGMTPARFRSVSTRSFR